MKIYTEEELTDLQENYTIVLSKIFRNQSGVTGVKMKAQRIDTEDDAFQRIECQGEDICKEDQALLREIGLRAILARNERLTLAQEKATGEV